VQYFSNLFAGSVCDEPVLFPTALVSTGDIIGLCVGQTAPCDAVCAAVSRKMCSYFCFYGFAHFSLLYDGCNKYIMDRNCSSD